MAAGKCGSQEELPLLHKTTTTPRQRALPCQPAAFIPVSFASSPLVDFCEVVDSSPQLHNKASSFANVLLSTHGGPLRSKVCSLASANNQTKYTNDQIIDPTHIVVILNVAMEESIAFPRRVRHGIIGHRWRDQVIRPPQDGPHNLSPQTVLCQHTDFHHHNGVFYLPHNRNTVLKPPNGLDNPVLSFESSRDNENLQWRVHLWIGHPAEMPTNIHVAPSTPAKA